MRRGKHTAPSMRINLLVMRRPRKHKTTYRLVNFGGWLRHNRLSVLLLFLSSVAFYLPGWLFNHQYHVPVGIFVTVMGFVAAAMTLREPSSKMEKAFWMLVLTALMVAEIRNLYKADAEQAITFSGISQKLEITKEKLDSTSDDIRATSQAVGRAAGALEATAQGIQEAASDVTGGDTFCYLEIYHGTGPRETNHIMSMLLKKSGTYPLYEVGYDLAESIPLEGLPGVNRRGKGNPTKLAIYLKGKIYRVKRDSCQTLKKTYLFGLLVIVSI